MSTLALEGKSHDELVAIIEAMRKNGQRKLSMKVTEKGGLSVYGLGRFPVTLYRSQWERLVEHIQSGAITEFIATNADLLAVKD